MTKEEARERLRIPELWRRFGLRGAPAKSCKSPFRDDRNPSFSVSADCTLWNDFATGEGGDAIDFLARLTGAGAFTRVGAFVELAASIYGDPEPLKIAAGASSRRGKARIPEPDDDALGAALGAAHEPEPDDCHRIAAIRGLDPIAVWTAGRIGTLLVGSIGGFACWILTDCRRRLAEARRISGELFPASGSLAERKAHTLKGSRKDWPVGISPRLTGHERIKKILLVEGGPDYLAAMHIIARGGADCLPVAILGAACADLHPDALTLFRRRRVRIVAHNGASAAGAWFACLSERGCTVDVVEPRAAGAKDLNDLVRLKPPEEITEILP